MSNRVKVKNKNKTKADIKSVKPLNTHRYKTVKIRDNNLASEEHTEVVVPSLPCIPFLSSCFLSETTESTLEQDASLLGQDWISNNTHRHTHTAAQERAKTNTNTLLVVGSVEFDKNHSFRRKWSRAHGRPLAARMTNFTMSHNLNF